ncbi:unnamed protein product, partial [Lymnaea stagnalis]
PLRKLLNAIRHIAQWLAHRQLIKICLVLVALLVFFFFKVLPLLQDSEVVYVLHPGFPLIVTSEKSYPSILENDVSGELPIQLQQDVATRFRHHMESKEQGPVIKLLSLNSREPSCLAMIKGDEREISYSLQYMEHSYKTKRLPLADYAKATEDCQSFIKQRGYITHAIQEEKDFPIAYSIMMYRDADQAERLLRAIYRPSNYYCIHVDAKADKDIQDAMKGIAGCFPNVFLASKQNVVDWAQFNSLEPWLYCMRDLWKFSWKYFINLTGQEFPLKTNLQIVKILKALNGSNVVDTTTYGHYARRWYENFPPPNNIQPYKGLVFMLASRGYVDYILHEPVAQDLLEWVRHTDFPDESFFSTLNHNPHLKVPGSYRGRISLPPLTHKTELAATRVRRVCIFGVKDLERLVDRRELFANKLIADFEPLALDCLE